MKTYYRHKAFGNVTTAASPDAFARPDEWQRLTQREGKQEYASQHAESLQKQIRAAAGESNKVNVYCIIRSVSASGMSRAIDLFIVDAFSGNNPPHLVRITYPASVILDWKLHKREGMTVHGCGMDMCWHTVDCLQRSLPELEANGIELVSRIL